MENEIWKDVVGYEGLYKVSSLGNVKSLNYKKSGKEAILKHSIMNGYCQVNLWKNGKPKTKLIHSLMGMSFIDKDYIKKGLVVNHRNFIRNCNILENIEVVSHRENSNKKHLPCTSRYSGVFWDKNKNKWVSTITIKKIQKRLGAFDSEEEASKYYEDALVCINEGRISDIKSAIKIRVKASKYKHIHYNKKRGTWVLQPYVGGKYVYLGSYSTEQEAYLALCKYKESK